MRIIYYVDSSDAVNWGGQATSAGIRHLVETTYPKAGFIPTKFRPLPLKQATFLRWIPNLMIYWCVKNRRLDWLKAVLHWYGIDRNIYDEFDVVCFNGEGAIHEKSGHFFRLLGSLYAFKLSGKRVYSLNQTVDVHPGSLAARLLQLVYPVLDRVAVREPASLRVITGLGVNAELIGDAAYALPLIPDAERAALARKFYIAKPFVAVTASSAMARNRSSVDRMARLLDTLSGLGLRMIFLANTKTDLYLAKKLAGRHDFRIIDYTAANYREAIAIISLAELIVGGRQHPNIFAAKYGVPFIALAGNTHKMSGVVELLNYPLPVFTWDFDANELSSTARRILAGEVDFSQVSLPVINTIDLGHDATS